MENFENNENLTDQPSPVIEKVSLKELRQEHQKLEDEKPTFADEMIDAMMNLTDEQADMVMKELDKKIEYLARKKGEENGSK